MTDEYSRIRATDILDEAIVVLELGGWQRGANGDTTRVNVPHCLVGAVHTAAIRKGYPLGDSDLIYAACAALSLKLGTPFLTEWNDEKARDVDHVIEKIREAADELRV